MLNFNFSEKGLGLVSPPHFVHDFSRKMLLMLYSINCANCLNSLNIRSEIWTRSLNLLSEKANHQSFYLVFLVYKFLE